MTNLVKSAERRIRRGVITGLSGLIRRSSNPPQPDQLRHAKVLLIRQDRIGDVLVSTPLIAALKRHHPTLRLDILVSRNNHMVVDGIPEIDKRWVYTKSLFRSASLIRRIRAERYDVAIDLMDNPSATSTVLCLLAAARWTIGISKENEFIYDVKVPLLSRREVHIVRRIAELLRPFGIDPDKEHLQIAFDPGERAGTIAHRALVGQGIPEGRALCVNISAGSSSRFWGVEQYTNLLTRLESEFPKLQCVIACKPGDEHHARTIAGRVRQATVLQPTTDFLVFAAQIRSMAYVITPDTAIVHLAAAFGVPCVVMYIQTDPDLRIWDPYGVPHASLISRVDSLGEIGPGQVFAAIASLMKTHPAPRRLTPVKKR